VSDPATHITAGTRPIQNGVHAGAPSAAGVDVPTVQSHGPLAGWLRFWFTPADPTALHGIRLLSGLLFAFWLLAFAGHQTDLFSLTGWFDATAYKEAGRLPGGPPVPFGWSILYLCGTSTLLVNIVYWTSIVIMLLFAAGVATRLTSVLAWVIVVSFVANPALSFDADFLLVVLAFYLMVGYVLFGQWSRPLSATERLLGPAEGNVVALFRRGRGTPVPSYAANLAVRLLQVHFALIVVVCALHKLQISDWWSGVAFWYPLFPPLRTNLASVRTTVGVWYVEMLVLSLAGYLTLAWQLGFPLFAWRRRWRPVLIGGSLLGWLGCLFIYGLPLFGPVFVIASLGFVPSAQWRQSLRRLGNLIHPTTGQLQPAVAGVDKSSKVGR
jgi:hypothetical protein